MFNNKVRFSEYEELRSTFLMFLAQHKMSFFEAEDVLDLLKEDIKGQVCSGIYDKSSDRLGSYPD